MRSIKNHSTLTASSLPFSRGTSMIQSSCIVATRVCRETLYRFRASNGKILVE